MKQAIIINSDVKMSKGKTASQAAHASIGAYEMAKSHDVGLWRKQGMPKIVLKATQKQLVELCNLVAESCTPYYLVHDAGLTQVEPGTITALALGPDFKADIDEYIKDLKLL